MKRTNKAALIAAGRLEDHQVHFGFLELRGQLIPSVRAIGHPLLDRAQADIEMLLAHVDTGIGPLITIRYPTLPMHVHDGQLFGLHELDETGRYVDQWLTHELEVRRRIRFGVPTAKIVEARECGQSGQFELTLEPARWKYHQTEDTRRRDLRAAGRRGRGDLGSSRAPAELPAGDKSSCLDINVMRYLNAICTIVYPTMPSTAIELTLQKAARISCSCAVTYARKCAALAPT